METLKIYYDPIGKTLTVWFSEPTEEDVVEETGEEILLIKNRVGKVIGLEHLNYELAEGQQPNIQLISA
ncbi:MAG: DUF2283 domain-containing protein [Cyanobacteria bacterium P01_D01_bin.6]